MWFPLSGELDDTALNQFLDQQGIERWRREMLLVDDCNAVCRYAQIPDRKDAKDQLESFLAAAEELEKTFTPIGGPRYVQFYHSIA
jgi:hypothetical protein